LETAGQQPYAFSIEPMKKEEAPRKADWGPEPDSGKVTPRTNPNLPRTSGGLKVVTISPGSVSLDDTDIQEVLPEEDGTPPPARKVDPYLGCTIDGRYKIEEVLGEGGMGVVYRCRHKIIDKKVAMKILRADLAARDTEVTERFLIEAKAASAIGNPHIIDISDFGVLPDGSTYFVMEYLDGVPLSKVVEGGTAMPVPRLLHVSIQLAEGLAAAHGAQIVHRDLKPDNIFLVGRGAERDFVKILDFGIAKVSSDASRLTRAGSVFGTPHYMSPEQAAGAPVDHRGDIYSLGVILYELCSGKVPFDADNFMGILTQHMYKAPVPIRALVPEPQEVPPGLDAIVLKCLSKRPEQRYQSMEELRDDLVRLRDGTIPNAVPEMMARSGGFNVPADYFKAAMPAPVPATPAGLLRERGRWPLYAGIAGVGAAVAIVVAIFATGSSSDASTQPPAAPTAAPETTAKAPAPQPQAAASKDVAIAIEPIDAHVWLGDKDLGASPVFVEVKDGQTLAVEVRREGFKSQTLVLDGKEPKRSVKLERQPGAKLGRPVPKGVADPTPVATPQPTPQPQPKPKSKPAMGGGEIVNPWGT
jgi:serine/threonine-protein kinase